MQTVVDILRAARDKISDPSRWTTRDYAKNKWGEPTSGHDPDAVCWCAYGAVMSVSNSFHARCNAEETLELAAKAIDPGFNCVADFNDTLGHEAVIEMFDAAIAKSEAA